MSFAKANINRIATIATLCLLYPATATAQTVSVEVTNQQQQTFQGFGASLTNTVGAFLPDGGRANKPASVARSIYNLIFAPNNAKSLNLTYLRLSLNADSYQPYSNAPYDFPTAVVKTGQADVIKAAKSFNPALKLYYSNWTPPYWMKQNGLDYNVNDPVTWNVNAPTTNHLLASQKNNYANFLKNYCADFRKYFGYGIDALSFQNEPDINVPYGSCIYPDTSNTDPNVAQYIPTLNAVRDAFTWSSTTQLWGPEAGDSKNTNYIANAGWAGQLNALCVHSYGSSVGQLPLGYRNNLPVHMTEWSTDQKYFLINNQPSQPWIASALANQFCKDVNDGQAVTWFWWSIMGNNDLSKADEPKLTDLGSCLITANLRSNPSSVYKFIDQSVGNLPADHSLIVLNDNKTYPVNKGPYESPYKSDFGSDYSLTSNYYVFRRLTQSILPGSVSLRTTTNPDSNGGQNDISAAGFRLPSGKYCIVIANQSLTTHTVNLKLDALASTPYASVKVYYTSIDGSGKPVNDTSWKDTLTNGQATITCYAPSVFIYVQQ